MAQRLEKSSPIGTYQPFNITGAATVQPIGRNYTLATTSSVVAGAGQALSFASIPYGMEIGSIFNIVDGANSEYVKIRAVNFATNTIIADFAFGHASGVTVISQRGTFLGPVLIGNPGSGTNTLTLYNGNPNLRPVITTAGYGKIGTIAITTTTQPLYYSMTADFGLWYTLAVGSTAPDITVHYMDHNE